MEQWLDDLALQMAAGMSRRGALRCLAVAWGSSALSLMFPVRVQAAPLAQAGPGTPAGPDPKIRICHRTGSARNSWELVEVSESSIPAHRAHGDAINPNFQTDPAHCGGCGVSCGGTCSTCQNGTCVNHVQQCSSKVSPGPICTLTMCCTENRPMNKDMCAEAGGCSNLSDAQKKENLSICWKRSSNGRTPSTDGCSAGPEPWNTFFKPSCDAHDICYSTCNKSKDECDDEFFLAMAAQCATLPLIQRPACLGGAEVFSDAVEVGATSAYLIDQHLFCKCCGGTRIVCPPGYHQETTRCCPALQHENAAGDCVLIG